ncbi:MAG: hypothetical protein KGJ00_21385, partial [Bradyrhizobium sp.]|nr:hypothetical protein [Bradyrhizobium sp.]
GTQGSQVRILPLRPFFQLLLDIAVFQRNDWSSDSEVGKLLGRSPMRASDSRQLQQNMVSSAALDLKFL